MGRGGGKGKEEGKSNEEGREAGSDEDVETGRESDD